jgi:hypothetical protein
MSMQTAVQNIFNLHLISTIIIYGARSSAVGWGTVLPVGRSRVLIPDGVIGIFHLHNLSGRIIALGLTQPLTEMSTRNISWGVKVAGAYKADNLTTFVCRLFWNLGAPTSCNPQGLSRPVMGLLYLYLTCPVIQCHIPEGLNPSSQFIPENNN